EQVELDVAAAPDELLVTLGVGPGSLEIAADELRIDVAESRADVAGKGKVGVPVARVVVVVEDAADAARLLAVRQVEVLVAPLAIAVVIGDRVGGAGLLHGAVEVDAVRILLGAAAVEYRGESGAAAEPPLAGHHHARVHVHGGDVRVPRMRDEGDAGGPEARAFFGAVHLGGKFGRELAEDG